MDLVEGESAAVVPVDYKRGRPRDGEHGPEGAPPSALEQHARDVALRSARARSGAVIRISGQSVGG
jgi:hypothetical protein